MIQSQVPMAHTYNPSYSGGRNQEDRKYFRRPYLKKKKKKKSITKKGLVELLKV
jgi:hypothetical protein